MIECSNTVDFIMRSTRAMLVTFRTKAYANITMFGDVALDIIRLMGHSGTVPGAMAVEDIPAALARLRRAIANEEAAAVAADASGEDDDDEKDAISLRNRAFPLIEMLEAAERDKVPIMWDE